MREPTHAKVLVLNSSFQPLGITSVRRAAVLVHEGRADVVETDGVVLRSARAVLDAPSVIRVHRSTFVQRNRSLFSRRRVLARDGHRCGYCGHRADTIDHVLPASRGGRNEWGNVVAACRTCNSRKADRTPEEAGMVLQWRPHEPRGAQVLRLGVQRVHPAWERWLTA